MGFEYGYSEVKEDKYIAKEIWTDKDDDWGNAYVYYHHPVVLSMDEDAGLAEIKTYSTGSLDIMILPQYE